MKRRLFLSALNCLRCARLFQPKLAKLCLVHSFARGGRVAALGTEIHKTKPHMSWIRHFLTSSIGKKLIMSLTGLFLMLFLVVHLVGNLQLLINDGGQAFNVYTKFMTSNPLIKTISYTLYTFILLHAIQGWMLWRQNSAARGGKGYAVKVTRATGTNAFAASNMGWLGTIIFVFLLIHLYQFWWQMKMDALPYVDYAGESYKNLYLPVEAAFSNPGYVAFYVLSMVVIAYHLWHGFQSSFQTLGLNHKKYTPFIKWVGKIYAILIPVGFALIPILFFLNIKPLTALH
jgi:succinate dehydrogenase / fumarate reductase cytochrome b subunit